MSATDSAALFASAVAHYERGDAERAWAGAEQVLLLQPDHPGALHMTGSLLLGRHEPALALPRLEAARRAQPQNPELLHLLGDTYFELVRWTDAAASYQAAWHAGRRGAELLNNLGIALKEAGDVEGAIAAYQEALRAAPDDADVHNNLAIALNRRHDYEGAMAAYRRSAELKPDNPNVWSNLAMLYEQSNMLEEAEDALQHGLALAPDLENLHLIAARCARRRGDLDAGISRLELQIKRLDLSPMVRRSMEFELGRGYDALGDAEHAYAHLLAGNRLSTQVWPALRAGADTFMSDLQHRLEYFREAKLDWAASPLESRPSPVFLVGFPRSGTTLMDTMLGAHPDIDVLEEEPMLEVVIAEIQRLNGSYPEGLAKLTPQQILALREIYWRDAETRLSGASRSLLLDKNPFSSAHAGVIKLLFPKAKFIFALRHPCDVVLSCFMQGFGNNAALENFRDLPSAAETYRRVLDLWQLHRQQLTLDVHVLRYESLVADKRGEMERLLEFLGLAWDDAMLDHTRQAKKRGRIYTPSYHQVIKPVYKDSLDRWQRYRPYFGSALETLKPYVESFGYRLD